MPTTSVDTPSPPGRGDPAYFAGYRIVSVLRREESGTLYLGRPLSFGGSRSVFLKAVRPEWSDDAPYAARLVRSAYAAARLRHPNLLRIEDFGRHRGALFCRIEAAEGTSLQDLLDRRGRLEPIVAARYILQAARALKHAHGRGLTHGQVRPADLWLSDDGLVRLSGLGLALTPANVAADLAANPPGKDGRPRPDASPKPLAVDRDLFTLGRTFHTLIAGQLTSHDPSHRPNFDGLGVPPAVARIVTSLVASSPQPHYGDMDAVIDDLERLLNVAESGPREEEMRAIEQSAAEFESPRLARLRPRILLGYFGGCLALALLFALLRKPFLCGGFAALALLSAIAHLLVSGPTRETPLWSKIVELAATARPADLFYLLSVLGILATLLVLFGLHGVGIAFVLAAVVLALAFHFEVDRKLDAARREPIARARSVLRSLRLRGLDENTLRRFVARQAGEGSGPFQQALFGPDALVRVSPWRDPIVRLLDASIASRRRAIDREKLQEIEERGLVGLGVNLLTARRQSRRIAQAMLLRAAELRRLETSPDAPPIERPAAPLDLTATPEDYLEDHEAGLLPEDRVGLLDRLLGPRLRFVAGSILLIGCLAWMHQNALLSGSAVSAVASKVIESGDTSQVHDLARSRLDAARAAADRSTPLRLPFAPAFLSNLFRDFNPAVAGLVLILSSFFGGWRLSLFAFASAAVILLGRTLGLPDLGPIPAAWSALAIGLGIAAAGMLFGRGR